MILLHGVIIPKGYVEDFRRGLVSFLENEEYLYGDGIRYLNSFLKIKKEMFGEEDLSKLLNLVCDRKAKYEQYSTFNLLSWIVQENKITFSDEVYIFKILGDFDYFNKGTKQKKHTIISLWRISNKQIRKKIEQEIIKRLKNNFEINLYRDSSLEEIIDYNLFFEDYVKEINDGLSKSKGQIYGEYDSKLRITDYDFVEFILFIYKIEVKGNDSRLKLFTNITPLVNFCLFREKSNLLEFKIEWITLMNPEITHKEWSKIKGLKKNIEDDLKINYNKDISDIYTKYYL